MLFYLSLDFTYCEASSLWIVPKKDSLLLAAGDPLRLDCVHEYKGTKTDVASFSKDGTLIPMSNNKGFTILLDVHPGSENVTSTTTLKKVVTKVTDSGIYRCSVEDKRIDITVNVIEVNTEDAILPTNTTDVLNLRCSRTGMTADSHNVRWVWSFNNLTLRNDEKYRIKNEGNSGILQIKNPDRTDMGKYLCSLTQKNDVKIETPRSVYLRAGPAIDKSAVRAGRSGLELKCIASGFPVPTIVWSKEGAELNSTRYHIINTEQNTVTSFAELSDVNKDDDGVYYCTAKNEIEPFNETAQIKIGKAEISSLMSAGGPVFQQSLSIPYSLPLLLITTYLYC